MNATGASPLKNNRSFAMEWYTRGPRMMNALNEEKRAKVTRRENMVSRERPKSFPMANPPMGMTPFISDEFYRHLRHAVPYRRYPKRALHSVHQPGREPVFFFPLRARGLFAGLFPGPFAALSDNHSKALSSVTDSSETPFGTVALIPPSVM